MSVAYIGYLECDNCNHFVHIKNPDELTIWYHPDDSRSLASVKCPKCKHTTESRIEYDDMANFKIKGCKVKDFGDKFVPLTEELIDEWDIVADLKSLLKQAA
jgi:phage FluMu protein Com